MGRYPHFSFFFLALLIWCRARNPAHIGDLYPASSNSSICLVFFRNVVTSSCSRPSHHSFLYPPLIVVHPCPGCANESNPQSWWFFVLSTRSSHNSHESWLLTKQPVRISQLRIESDCFSNSLHCHSSVTVLLVVESARVPRICLYRRKSCYPVATVVLDSYFGTFLSMLYTCPLDPFAPCESPWFDWILVLEPVV